VRHAGHDVGGDTRQVLRELLNMPDEAIDALQAQHVISCAAKAAVSETAYLS